MPPPGDAYLAWKNDKNYLPSVPGHKMDYRRITALRLLLFFQTNMDFTVICGVIIWRRGGRVPLSHASQESSPRILSKFISLAPRNEWQRDRERRKFVYSFHDWGAVTYCYLWSPVDQCRQGRGGLLCSHHMWLSSQETVKSCHRWLVTDDCLQSLVTTILQQIRVSCVRGPSSLDFNGLIWNIHSLDRQFTTRVFMFWIESCKFSGNINGTTPGTMKWKLFLLEEHCIYLIFE